MLRKGNRAVNEVAAFNSASLWRASAASRPLNFDFPFSTKCRVAEPLMDRIIHCAYDYMNQAAIGKCLRPAFQVIRCCVSEIS